MFIILSINNIYKFNCILLSFIINVYYYFNNVYVHVEIFSKVISEFKLQEFYSARAWRFTVKLFSILPIKFPEKNS